MKDYEVCAYCIGINNSDYCPCENIKDIRNTFICDFYATDFKKVATEIRADAIGEIANGIATECGNKDYYSDLCLHLNKIFERFKEKTDE